MVFEQGTLQWLRCHLRLFVSSRTREKECAHARTVHAHAAQGRLPSPVPTIVVVIFPRLLPSSSFPPIRPRRKNTRRGWTDNVVTVLVRELGVGRRVALMVIGGGGLLFIFFIFSSVFQPTVVRYPPIPILIQRSMRSHRTTSNPPLPPAALSLEKFDR